jgi:hypothetical protein
MRKRYKKKNRSCALCKPHKMKWEKRWKFKDLLLLEEFEKYQNKWIALTDDDKVISS